MDIYGTQERFIVSFFKFILIKKLVKDQLLKKKIQIDIYKWNYQK
jgi:hypothetical protein